jgi:hypothetical protein
MLNRCQLIKLYKILSPFFVIVIIWKCLSWLLLLLKGEVDAIAGSKPWPALAIPIPT